MASKDVKVDLNVNGDISASGVLKSTNSAANEGGEIQLSLPSSGSTLSSGVNIDVYQNKLRIFEAGGTNRGAYIDLTAASAGVASDLLAGGGGGSSDSFKTISISGQSDVVADSSTDTLTLINGTNITMTTNATNDSITINSTGNFTSVDSIVYPDYITFDTTPETVPSAAGSIYWDSGESAPGLILNANVDLKLGQEQVVLVANQTGSSIAKGSVVYINGAAGQRPTIALSDADTEATSSKTLGLTAETIANGAEGFVTTFGVLRGVNTDGLSEGAMLWLSSTAGGYTTTVPAEPAHSVFLGYVVKAHISSGEIFVNPQNGYELTELHGVTIDGTPADNEVLAYDTTSGLWINQTASEAGLAVTAGTLAQFASTTSSQLAGIISDETGTGSLVFGTSPTIATPALTLSTTTSTTEGRIAWDSTNDKIIVGDGSTAREFASSTLVTNAQSGTTYSLVLADKDELIELSNASAITLTVPLNSSQAFPVGSQIYLLQTNTGQVTVQGAVGVTVNATPGLKLRAQWSSATLIKRATDTWVLIGDLTA